MVYSDQQGLSIYKTLSLKEKKVFVCLFVFFWFCFFFWVFFWGGGVNAPTNWMDLAFR